MLSNKLYGLAVLFCAVLLTACSAPIVKDPTFVSQLPASETTPRARSYTVAEYLIAPGDTLDIKFFFTPELNQELVVRPDGKISLQLIPEVSVAGRTPADLATDLQQQYSSRLDRSEVSVIVRSVSPRKVFLDGEVESPGSFDLVGPTTVMQAVTYAGGFLDSARMDEIILIRRRFNEEPQIITMNLRSVIEGRDMGQDIYVMPADIVYVPKSSIANVNQWVDLYIRRNFPLPVTYGLGG